MDELDDVLEKLARARASSENASKQLGAIKWFDAEKGYGFIIPDDDGSDIFFHQSDLRIKQDGEDVEHILCPGRRVEFDIRQSEKGPRAEMVTLSFAPWSDSGDQA